VSALVWESVTGWCAAKWVVNVHDVDMSSKPIPRQAVDQARPFIPAVAKSMRLERRYQKPAGRKAVSLSMRFQCAILFATAG